MKGNRIGFLVGIICFFNTEVFSQVPSYPLRFQFKDGNGEVRDTLVLRASFKRWSNKPSFPEYLQWKNHRFSVLLSNIHGIGLFADSATTFSTNEQIGYAFYKINSTGRFQIDYQETNLGSFINNSDSPNLRASLHNKGIILSAIQEILPGTELTVNYREIMDLFPGDEGVKISLKYW